jgi:hypothetical protein
MLKSGNKINGICQKGDHIQGTTVVGQVM